MPFSPESIAIFAVIVGSVTVGILLISTAIVLGSLISERSERKRKIRHDKYINEHIQRVQDIILDGEEDYYRMVELRSKRQQARQFHEDENNHSSADCEAEGRSV